MQESVKENAAKLFTRYQHYYVRQSDGKPIATVAVGVRRGSGRICRGISICSTVENFNRKEGQTKAIARMVEAALKRKNDERIAASIERASARKSALSVDRFLDEVGYAIAYKSAYNVVPFPNEKKILRLT